MNKAELLSQPMVVCTGCGWEIGRGSIWNDPLCDDCGMDKDLEQQIEREDKEMSKWTVWVGGSEVNLCYLSQQQAENMAQAWKAKGYDDVVIEEIK
jgi:predicted RNA-binding Zn-ribbon protein involved in translation (DUF1610 family)